MPRNRFRYVVITIAVLLLGLASRRFSAQLPPFVRTYVGDVLWALMVFFGFTVLVNRQPPRQIAWLTLLVSFAIEAGQLYHAPWIDSVRATRLSGLVLGFGFLWSDLLCYCLGVAIGILLDQWLIAQRR